MSCEGLPICQSIITYRFEPTNHDIHLDFSFYILSIPSVYDCNLCS